MRYILCRILHAVLIWQGRGDSNPQPNDLESFALPLELQPFINLQNKGLTKKKLISNLLKSRRGPLVEVPFFEHFQLSLEPNYSTISTTTPAPTVRPPSRIANRSSFSIATGAINSISTSTRSPGITISVPAFKVTTPVTSVVLK